LKKRETQRNRLRRGKVSRGENGGLPQRREGGSPGRTRAGPSIAYSFSGGKKVPAKMNWPYLKKPKKENPTGPPEMPVLWERTKTRTPGRKTVARTGSGRGGGGGGSPFRPEFPVNPVKNIRKGGDFVICAPGRRGTRSAVGLKV